MELEKQKLKKSSNGKKLLSVFKKSLSRYNIETKKIYNSNLFFLKKFFFVFEGILPEVQLKHHLAWILCL